MRVNEINLRMGGRESEKEKQREMIMTWVMLLLLMVLIVLVGWLVGGLLRCVFGCLSELQYNEQLEGGNNDLRMNDER